MHPNFEGHFGVLKGVSNLWGNYCMSLTAQMEAEKAQLYEEKQGADQERSGLREELVRVEQEKLDLDSEKVGLAHTLDVTEQTRERLEEEIMMLNKDRAEVTEQLNTVRVLLSMLNAEALCSYLQPNPHWTQTCKFRFKSFDVACVHPVWIGHSHSQQQDLFACVGACASSVDWASVLRPMFVFSPLRVLSFPTNSIALVRVLSSQKVTEEVEQCSQRESCQMFLHLGQISEPV